MARATDERFAWPLSVKLKGWTQQTRHKAGALRRSDRWLKALAMNAELAMNASLESVSTPPTLRPAVPLTAYDFPAREGVLEVPGELALYYGGTLAGVSIAWRLVGPANAPVVCALGGISANRRVCLTDDPRQGWWSEIVGPG